MNQHYARFLVLLVVSLLANACSAVPIQEAPDPADYLYETPSIYYLYTPENYTPDQKWPVFVGIHPEGGTGLDCWNTWQSYADRDGFVLVCPSLAEADGNWHRQSGLIALADILNQVARDVSIQEKFFFAGYSAGGQFVQAIMIEYSQIMSGAAILAAPYYYPPDTQARDIPVLVIIGQSEPSVAVQSAQLYVDQLRQDGYNVVAEFPTGLDHRLTRAMVEKTLELFRQVHPPLDG